MFSLVTRRREAAIFPQVAPFATNEDFAECRRLHRRHGTTYYFSSRCFGPAARRRIDALYGFVRVPDEWVDNPEVEQAETSALLQEFRCQTIRGFAGECPTEAVLRAFCDIAREVCIPLSECLSFLDSMVSDLTQNRYKTYDDLRGYMRGSAVSVGLMMCRILEAGEDESLFDAASALAEAMQLTNFLRDVREDADRGRIYLPLEDLHRFGVAEQEILAHAPSGDFRRLIEFEIERARELYASADLGIPLLPRRAQKGVKLSRILYSRILDRIERQSCDVFRQRARTTWPEKLIVAARVLAGR